MFTNFITPSKDAPSRSGLYANQLPGVTLNLLDDLTKNDQEDWEGFWSDIYERSIINFVSDVQGKMADKFLIDLQLLSRETSSFKDDINTNTGDAGITLSYALPRYGVLHVVRIEFYADEEQATTPTASIVFYENNAYGRVLLEKEVEVSQGLNVVNIDTDFSVDKLFIGFDPEQISIRETKNRYFDNAHYFDFNELSCYFPCYGNARGSVTQVNGGGINVIYNATCSIKKFVEHNLNIFKEAFWYRIGLELIRERIFSDRFNRWTTMQSEDAEKKEGAYQTECELKLNNAVRSLCAREDSICFECKSTVSGMYLIP